MMECTASRSPGGPPTLPPGFRFHPTDEELLVHYLKKKAASCPLPVPIVAEIDLYKFDPWDLPAKANFGEHEWYFFSPRDRKYPNGARPNRAAASGYWKATGTDKPILTCGGTQKVGVKKALVFYKGRPPKGVKTNWIMHEYRLADTGAKPNSFGSRKSLRLDDWVLCRIYMKIAHSHSHSSAHSPRVSSEKERDESSCVEEVLASLPEIEDPKMNILPRLGSFGGLVMDPFFENCLGENTEHDTSAVAAAASTDCMTQGIISRGDATDTVPRTLVTGRNGIVPKLETMEMDYGRWDGGGSSLKLEFWRDDGNQLARRSLLMSLPNLVMERMPAAAPVVQHKSHQSTVELESSFKWPFAARFNSSFS